MSELDIKRIRGEIDATQEEFAKMLGVSSRTVQNWERGKKIPESKREMLRKIYTLHTSEESPSARDVDSSEIKAIRRKMNITQSELAKLVGVDIKTIQNWESGRKIPNSKRALLSSLLNAERLPVGGSTSGDTVSLPLIPVDAMAGALNGLDQGFSENECEKYVVPIFSGAKYLIHVQGDSMMPAYMPGDILACMPVPLDKLWFQWGKVYVISTRQGVLVKRIEKSSKEGYLSIHSENERYSPFDLPVSEVNGVALVVGRISLI